MATQKQIEAGKNNLAASRGHSKGKTGIRKKVTKSLIEWLEEVVDNNKADFMQTLAELAMNDPEKYAKTMVEIFKLIVPRQVQAEINMSGNANQGPPVINFNFGDKEKPKETEAAAETIEIEAPKNPQLFKLSFGEPEKIIDIDSEEIV